MSRVYETSFTPKEMKIFNWQKSKKLLDRFDITALLLAHKNKFGSFTIEKEYYEALASGNYRKKKGLFPVNYNLMIIDEFQNYLSEQLDILSVCSNNRLKSIVYVGDVAQQTQLGTIRNQEQMGVVGEGRVVKLEKVYRNAKEILKYVQSLGYAVEVPEQLKSGPPVRKVLLDNVEDQIKYIEKNSQSKSEITIGILAKETEYLDTFKKYFKDKSSVHCLSYYEAQGVEFDSVFIVGFDKQARANNYSEELQKEIQAVEKDLLYVALTRAMQELHILKNAT